jgi:HlyD family secretion protein
MTMDIARSLPKRRVTTSRLLAAGTAAAIVLLAIVLLGFRKPSASAERSELTIATVEEGPLVRQVRGHGSFISRQVRVVVAPVAGRVSSVLQQVGATVTPATPLFELSSPEVEQAEAVAKLSYDGAVAALSGHKADVIARSLERQSAYRSMKVDQEDARMRADIAAKLAKEGVGSDMERQLLERRAANLRDRLEMEQRRLDAADRAAEQQIRAEEAQVAQLRSFWLLKQAQREALYVRAGQNGVLQELSVEPGQSVIAGAAVGKIVDTRQLKVRVAVAEADARQVSLGNAASVEVDARSLAGRVVRVDPSVSNGNVSLDVDLLEAVPENVRPDLTVEATINIGRVERTLKVARPPNVGDYTTANVFVLDGPSSAHRAAVKFGRSSISEIEVLAGASRGSRLVVSAPDRLDAANRIDIK